MRYDTFCFSSPRTRNQSSEKFCGSTENAALSTDPTRQQPKIRRNRGLQVSSNQPGRKAPRHSPLGELDCVHTSNNPAHRPFSVICHPRDKDKTRDHSPPF